MIITIDKKSQYVIMSAMSGATSARRAHIVGAATSVFLRYGFGRTTMADIAQASGLSRPTLYLTFPDKESVFRAVIEAMIEAKMAQVRTGISGLPTLGEKLLYACNAWAAEGYELVQAHPDARDMFDLGFEFRLRRLSGLSRCHRGNCAGQRRAIGPRHTARQARPFHRLRAQGLQRHRRRQCGFAKPDRDACRRS